MIPFKMSSYNRAARNGDPEARRFALTIFSMSILPNGDHGGTNSGHAFPVKVDYYEVVLGYENLLNSGTPFKELIVLETPSKQWAVAVAEWLLQRCSNRIFEIEEQ